MVILLIILLHDIRKYMSLKMVHHHNRNIESHTQCLRE